MTGFGVENISELFYIGDIGIYLLIALGNSILLTFSAYRFLQTLQLRGYTVSKFYHNLKNRNNLYLTRLCLTCLLAFLAFLLINSTLAFLDMPYLMLAGFVAYFFFIALYIDIDRKSKLKTPLKFTARMKRLIATLFILIFISTFALIVLVNVLAFYINNELLFNLKYSVICFTPILTPTLMFLSFYINKPFEEINNRRYLVRCKDKLKKQKDLIRIGITGSYGKTSIKEVLKTILSVKYNVLATPYSYNTPLGIAKSVLSDLTPSTDIFVAEMGARHIGDILELCDIVRPDCAILSGVTNQHLETFGSLENIKRTKFELIDNLENNGMAVFTADNDVAFELYTKCDKTKYLAGLNNRNGLCDVTAKNIRAGSNGSTFDLEIKGEDRIKCNTKLLGSHNISNICLAVAMCYKIGMTKEEIVQGITRLKSSPHRLELIECNNGVTVIDDAYNANVSGTIAALEVLSYFNGRKIVVTPGLVELGDIEREENYEFGKRLADVCDKVILVGIKQSESIKRGLEEKKFFEENIYVVKNLFIAKDLILKIAKTDDVVLFENDLPDTYNEG